MGAWGIGSIGRSLSSKWAKMARALQAIYGVHFGANAPDRSVIMPEKETLKRARRDKRAGRHGGPRHKVSRRRSRAITRALRREGRSAASHRALARQAHQAASHRSAASRSAAARKAVRTKGPAKRSAAARKAARTRARA